METQKPNEESSAAASPDLSGRAPRAPELVSLLVNDIHALCSQFNKAMRKAAEEGLQVDLTTTTYHQIAGAGSSYPIVEVRVLSEVS